MTWSPEEILSRRRIEDRQDGSLPNGEIAKRKLEQILNEVGKDFCIRYMSVYEYQELLPKSKAPTQSGFIGNTHREVLNPNNSGRYSSNIEVTEFIKHPTQFITNTAWDRGKGIVMSQGDIFRYLKGWYKENKNLQSEKMAKELRKFAFDLLNNLHSDYWYSFTGPSRDYRNYLKGKESDIQNKNSLPKDVIAEVENAVEKTKSDGFLFLFDSGIKSFNTLTEKQKADVEILFDFLLAIKRTGLQFLETFEELKKDELFLLTPENRRKVFTALIHSLGDGHVKHNSPYEIAVIFDKKVGLFKGKNDSWLHYNPEGNSPEVLSKSVLGVCALTSNKTVTNLLVRQQGKIGEMSHPVFNSKGNLLWPKS